MKKRKSKKQNKKSINKIIVGMIIVLVLLAAISVLTSDDEPLQSKEIRVTFAVGDKFGIIINKTDLDFGILIQDSSVSKEIVLQNQYDFPVRVEVAIDPAFENYLFGRTNILLQPDEEYVYNIGLIIPRDAEKREYEGFIRFDFFPIK